MTTPPILQYSNNKLQVSSLILQTITQLFKNKPLETTLSFNDILVESLPYLWIVKNSRANWDYTRGAILNLKRTINKFNSKVLISRSALKNKLESITNKITEDYLDDAMIKVKNLKPLIKIDPCISELLSRRSEKSGPKKLLLLVAVTFNIKTLKMQYDLSLFAPSLEGSDKKYKYPLSFTDLRLTNPSIRILNSYFNSMKKFDKLYLKIRANLVKSY